MDEQKKIVFQIGIKSETMWIACHRVQMTKAKSVPMRNLLNTYDDDRETDRKEKEVKTWFNEKMKKKKEFNRFSNIALMRQGQNQTQLYIVDSDIFKSMLAE